MKVRINATGDTIVMKFLRPNADTKLEGYILGYGSSMFSKQFIQLPENGQPYETEFGTNVCLLRDFLVRDDFVHLGSRDDVSPLVFRC